MTSGFYQYAKILANTTNYAKRMTRLSARIFGEMARPTEPTSLKVIKLLSAEPLDQTHNFVNYYPKHKEIHILMKTLRAHGLYRDEHQDFKDEMKRLRKLRGKGPPKKGEGKRSQKKKVE